MKHQAIVAAALFGLLLARLGRCNISAPTSELGRARRGAAGNENDQDDDWTAASEGSRSLGGAPVQPFPWLVSAWFPKDNLISKTLFAGFLIRLNNNHVLGHRSSCDLPQIEWRNKKKGEQISLRIPSEVNVDRGSPHADRLLSCVRSQPVRNNFGIFLLWPEAGERAKNYYSTEQRLIAPPPLQESANVTENCYVYSYSGSKDPNLRNQMPERVFTRFAVRFNGCKQNGMCSFKSYTEGLGADESDKAGALCAKFSDRGAPIMCAGDPVGEPKLSYLVAPSSLDRCAKQFNAWRVADHYPLLKAIVDRGALDIPIDPEADDVWRYSSAPYTKSNAPMAPRHPAPFAAHDDHADDDDDDDDYEADDEASGGSRMSVGGAPIEPFPWLAGAWFPKNNMISKSLFAGFLIRLTDNHVLGHRDTCDMPQIEWRNNRNGEQISLKLAPKVDVLEPGGKWSLAADRLLSCVRDEYLEHNFGIFTLFPERGQAAKHHYSYYNSLEHPPPLQDNVNVVNDCFLYSYSGNSDPYSRNQSHERVFAKLEVQFSGCNGNVCSFVTNRRYTAPHGSEKAGAACHELHDRGAPIMCGREPKLSFLVAPSSWDRCDDQFNAVRIADYYNKLAARVRSGPVHISMYVSREDVFKLKHPFCYIPCPL